MRIFRLLLVLWAGSLWSSVWVALTAFHFESDRHVAGLIAARLFGIETYIGMAVAVVAALRGERAQFLWCYAAVVLLAFNEWVLKIFMDRALAQGTSLGLGFGPWHGVSALVYLAACLSVAGYLYRRGAKV